MKKTIGKWALVTAIDQEIFPPEIFDTEEEAMETMRIDFVETTGIEPGSEEYEDEHDNGSLGFDDEAYHRTWIVDGPNHADINWRIFEI